MRERRRPCVGRVSVGHGRFVRSVESGDAAVAAHRAGLGAPGATRPRRQARCLQRGQAMHRARRGKVRWRSLSDAMFRRDPSTMPVIEPPRHAFLRFAPRGALQRAFPFRRILAGANMFNEMPSKGRGRHACVASQRSARRQPLLGRPRIRSDITKREQSC
jgi:hypothetical protein